MDKQIKPPPLQAAQSFHGELAASWEALGSGGPTLTALAAVCARAIIEPPDASRQPEPLSQEALAILYAARRRGVIEVRGVRTAFEAPGRMLAVYVEEDEHRTIAFRSQEHPEITVRFFDGFCQLCRAGMILHHLHRDFTLSRLGFQRAQTVSPEQVASELDQATEFGLHDR